MYEKYISKEYADLEQTVDRFREEYKNAWPYPSISFKNFFNPEFLDKVLSDFPDLSEGSHLKMKHENSDKLASSGVERFGPYVTEFVNFLNSEPFLIFLKKLASIERDLINDPYFYGGGLHQIKKGGYLRIHADFNVHDSLLLDRRLNLLVYLNKEWKEEYGGHFELWDDKMEKCQKKILPEFNTLALFSTTSTSYHGHPDPLNCPEDMSRKSLALYYYTNGRPEEEVLEGLEKHSTLYQKREIDKKNEVVKKDTVVKEKKSWFKKVFGTS
ncbi:hypothetical protein AXE80_04530 [Wenyingzhuangia fucanilytica]|uniref:Prolyl 4-hydroxylase alpha subunit Fe(2+) 2OG dioxygenase domain-containing protein n=1 Tax=Wenyingzhuangia fucanilytica TaxID=1790137 RepID=A0A1B1Y490_9FLAO|nr:2OG-Fe(II) oxygenase [Wenyingzhuangia fucanilytica]ANW95585.1 hypothetical protein AXE80_04530 [Wenyingzhuangia fucanilytica]